MDKMKRLVRPLVYILGFSVFSACTMTKTMPVADVPLSSETPEFVVTLSGGARLEVSSATVNHEGIRGVISVEDAERLETYFPGWRSAPLMRMNEYTVVIPRSDVSKVQITSTNGWATALVVVGVALASLVLIVAHVGITPLPVDPHSH
jgi:hypothetical protein